MRLSVGPYFLTALHRAVSTKAVNNKIRHNYCSIAAAAAVAAIVVAFTHAVDVVHAFTCVFSQLIDQPNNSYKYKK